MIDAPAMFEHCVRVYDVLKAEAQDEPVVVDDDGTKEVHPVWTGHLTQVFNRLGLAGPYYTAIMNHLKRMGSVLQVRRGGGSAQSKWMLLEAPTMEAFDNAIQVGNKPSVRKLHQQLQQRVEDLTRRVQVLEKAARIAP